jgi:glycosyltransferase involved in cell wall biosynthesis
MIQHGENGLLVAPRNPSALSIAIEQLLRDNTLADKLGTHARGSALGKFSIAATTRGLKHLLVRHAGIKPPRRALELDRTLPRGLFSRWF